MRQVVGDTWILQLVVIFMLIFVAFLALTLNYTKAFKVKNEMVTIIEKYEGLSNDSITLINNYLTYNNAGVLGSCSVGEYGMASLSTTERKGLKQVGESDRNNKYYYCISKVSTANSINPDRAKYKVRLFFKFSLPVIGDILTFSVEGNTIDITNSQKNDIESNKDRNAWE